MTSSENTSNAGDNFEATVVLNTNGLGKDLGVECVVYKVVDGEERFFGTIPFKAVSEEGNNVTYKLTNKMKDAGMFRYAFRVYPKNADLPHRMDFAYVRWI